MIVAAANPLTLLGTAFAVDLALLVSLDVPSAAAALTAELALVLLLHGSATASRFRKNGTTRHAASPGGGRSPGFGGTAKRIALLALAGLLLAVTVALYGRTSGAVLFSAGVATVSTGSLRLAAATGLRLVALGVPAAVLLAGLDPTRLGDALAQRLRLPARFVLPAVAATRLVGVLGEDRRTIALARRARGLSSRPAVLGLLVVAVRRGTDLATAMEARGLGAPGPRTWSRPSRFGRADLVVLAAGAVVVASALAVGLTAGTYRAVLAP